MSDTEKFERLHEKLCDGNLKPTEVKEYMRLKRKFHDGEEQKYEKSTEELLAELDELNQRKEFKDSGEKSENEFLAGLEENKKIVKKEFKAEIPDNPLEFITQVEKNYWVFPRYIIALLNAIGLSPQQRAVFETIWGYTIQFGKYEARIPFRKFREYGFINNKHSLSKHVKKLVSLNMITIVETCKKKGNLYKINFDFTEWNISTEFIELATSIQNRGCPNG